MITQIIFAPSLSWVSLSRFEFDGGSNRFFAEKMFYQFCIRIKSAEPPRSGPYSSQASVVILSVQFNQSVKSKGQTVQSELEKWAIQKGSHSTSGGLTGV
jgi:hypothetical protein